MSKDIINSYTERRRQLVEKMSVTTDEHFSGLISHAIITTDISMALFIEEFPCVSKDFSIYLQNQQSKFDSLIERTTVVSNNAVKVREKFGDSNPNDIGISEICVDVTKQTLTNIVQITEIEISVFETSISVITKTLQSLLDAANQKDVAEAFKELNKFLLGLTPIGPALSLVDAIKKIKGTYSLDEKKVDETLSFFREYLEKLYMWNVAAQTLIEYHKRMINNDKKHLDNGEMAKLAGLIVQKRFNDYVDNLHGQISTKFDH